MNLKEFVVVKDRYTELMIWTKDQWENYEKLKERAGDKSEFTCKAITTFNTNEELKEGGGMRWRKDDYEKLYGRAKAGYRIACYIDYDFYRDGGSHPMCRDICTIGQNPTHLEFSARGHGYSGHIEPDENELKNFVEECERLNVEWLDESSAEPAGEGWLEVEDNNDLLSEDWEGVVYHFLIHVENAATKRTYWEIVTGYIDEKGAVNFQSNDDYSGWGYGDIRYYKHIGNLPPLPAPPKKENL